MKCEWPRGGCLSVVWCAVSPGLEKMVEEAEGNEGYFERVGRSGGVGKFRMDKEMAEGLWR